METPVLNTLPGEAEDLALHVKLCEQRYLQLLHKLDSQDQQLLLITATLTEIKGSVAADHNDQLKLYLKWAGVVITALLGAIIHLLLK